MKKKSFLKRNAVFVILLTVIVSFAMFLLFQTGVFSFEKPKEEGSDDIEEPVTEVKEDVEVPVMDVAKTKDGIRVSWDITRNGNTIERVELYADDRYVADVSNLSSYSLPENLYTFDSDNVNFEIRVFVKDKDTVTQTRDFHIPKELEAKVSIAKSETTYKISVEYIASSNSKEVPRIFIGGIGEDKFTIDYQDTVKIEDGGKYQTTYILKFNEDMDVSQVFGRFIFDSVGENVDFQLANE